MVPDHWISTVITAITKLSLIVLVLIQVPHLSKGSSLLLEPASAGPLTVHYVFIREAT
jgi:hypothetical protein